MSAFKYFTKPSASLVLEATESWVGPGNEASPALLVKNYCQNAVSERNSERTRLKVTYAWQLFAIYGHFCYTILQAISWAYFKEVVGAMRLLLHSISFTTVKFVPVTFLSRFAATLTT